MALVLAAGVLLHALGIENGLGIIPPRGSVRSPL